jgi:proline dehydrogenase
MRIAKIMLRTQQLQAFGTHDDMLLDFVKREMKKSRKENVEFQTLYGFKPHLPHAKQGYDTRVYVPYGENWQGYVKRRLSELSTQR